MTFATGTGLFRLAGAAALALLGVAAPSTGQSLSVTPVALAAAQPQQPAPVRGSVPGPLTPGTLKLTLKDALERALQRNLAVVLGRQGADAANGGRLQGLSRVLPEAGASLVERRQTLNLETFGLPLPGFPALIGPFNVFDARVSLSQAVFDLGAFQRVVAGNRNLDAARHTLQDARDLVVVAAVDLYFQTIAAHSRVLAVQAQV